MTFGDGFSRNALGGVTGLALWRAGLAFAFGTDPASVEPGVRAMAFARDVRRFRWWRRGLRLGHRW